ncbi:MAG: oligogalacturonate lyase family protein [Candidatus Omnitrophica bacterium]|nr:oligogalacturonate lyase family protein [Candidatus Omnitrophota bacterium]
MDNKLIVSDVQQQKENELYIINIETGKSQILCWPDSSCNPERNQLGHVHPSFSPKGTYVIFTSDRDGKSSLFIVPL